MSKQLPLENRSAIVTGGASGIGRASALALAEQGAHVVIADVDEAKSLETVAAVQALGGKSFFVRTDVSSAAEVDALVRTTVEALGTLDVMFNNAGIALGASLLDWTPEQYDRVIRINQHGVFFGIQAAARAMRDLGKGGVILNTGSIYGELATSKTVAYQAAKAAVEVMTKVSALELAPLGIRVVNVAPGVIDTPILDGYKKAGVIDVLAKKQMRGALLQPDAVANVVAFLATDAARGINGTTVFVDDGYSSFK
jgi:NAD(P)-dependent dehydrogenase (short-subunit alcohol dehydrogenase family)